MRRKIIAGNWKMNKNVDESVALINELKERFRNLPDGLEVVICPPYTSLVVGSQLLRGSALKLGAQNMYYEDDGAFTGEISARMLKSIGCEYVILGHSERRTYFHESDDVVNKKVRKALASGLRPIICVGETLDERERGLTEVVVTRQVKGVLENVSADELSRAVIAYEPVWAIGTGKNATPQQANDIHRLIRGLISRLYDRTAGDRLIIQYGGSVKPENAMDLLSQPDVDGALVGGASLKAESFATIALASYPSG
ncbi:MAG: triose-phosphate isomerase [Bacteroidota bacterium]